MMRIVTRENAIVLLALNGVVVLVSVNKHLNHVIVLIPAVLGKKNKTLYVHVIKKDLNVIQNYVDA